ncbi:MAG: hypothetical protein AB7G75_14410 [Candidatus Binatia bacterium]
MGRSRYAWPLALATIDRKKATVAVLAMPDWVTHMRAVLESLHDEMDWYEIPPPEEQDDWLMQEIQD